CHAILPSSRAHRHLHSFPTRRSSDLPPRRATTPGSARPPPMPACWLPAWGVLRSRLSLLLGPSSSSWPEPRRDLRGSGPRCAGRSEEHTSELQSRENLVCRLLLEKKK